MTWTQLDMFAYEAGECRTHSEAGEDIIARGNTRHLSNCKAGRSKINMKAELKDYSVRRIKCSGIEYRLGESRESDMESAPDVESVLY